MRPCFEETTGLPGWIKVKRPHGVRGGEPWIDHL